MFPALAGFLTPQWGQVSAFELTWFPHSLHGFMPIETAPDTMAYRREGLHAMSRVPGPLSPVKSILAATVKATDLGLG